MTMKNNITKAENEFSLISLEEIVEILGLTIKKDNTNKLVAFLCMLSIYTENSQFNIIFNAPSSTGKSFIPMEVSSLFPKEDVMTLAYSSPMAFFHATGKWDDARKVMIIDLSNKIIIFQDQPHTELLQRLRPLLSHDEKILRVQIADKKQKAGLKTKDIELIGYPAVIFCSAGMKIDEQEGTRFLLLSPETDSEKIKQAVSSRIEKEADLQNYLNELNSNPKRKELMNRIIAIKQSGIQDVNISEHKELIRDLFWQNRKSPKPRHQRDIGRVMGLIKVISLLNFSFRSRFGDILEAKEDDVYEAFKLWDSISEAQEYNLPPFVFNLYWDVIVPEYLSLNKIRSSTLLGVTRENIRSRYYRETDTFLEETRLRFQILPMLQMSGLLEEEQDKNDKRVLRYKPTKTTRNNSVQDGRVNIEDSLNNKVGNTF